MLTGLHISNIVLIEKLSLEFGKGLNVLTGETGAGKSILLDALALALGARSDVGLVRHGCDCASVIAEFDSASEDLRSVLDENGIDYDEGIILRRNLTLDGKSRAWVNDIPVSIKTLKQIGDSLVEIHGQFANHSLLDPTTHRQALDSFAVIYDSKNADLIEAVKMTYEEYRNAVKRLNDLQDMLDKTASERDFLQHNVSELQALNVKVGEEEELSNRRTAIMNAEKDAAILTDALAVLTQNSESLDAQIFSAAHILERIKTEPNPYQAQIDALYDAGQTVSDVISKIKPDDVDIDSIDAIEERLFAIRAIARKHRVSADELPEKLLQMTQQLNAIDNSDAELKRLKDLVGRKESDFYDQSNKLTQARKNAANELRNRILAELPDLKLGQTDFQIEIKPTPPSAHGSDDALFMIKTNPGMPFAPLHKAASGGELARLMLALRVVLATHQDAHTFIFDEVDTGISGATASAVGQRLNKLAQESQALVITHSAQVAGFADRHFKIEKHTTAESTITNVSEITDNARLNEIARIISGAEITPESLATAKTLIKV